MKKTLLSLGAAVMLFTGAKAQETLRALSKGSVMIETSLSPYSMLKTTGFGFASNDGISEWSVGGEGGYFVADKFSVKLGLGVLGVTQDFGGGKETDTALSYKIGAKYYATNQFPFQVDLGGINSDGENGLLLGVQAGYAWFLKENIALEPGVRYDHGLNDNFSEIKTVSVKLGFSLHF